VPMSCMCSCVQCTAYVYVLHPYRRTATWQVFTKCWSSRTCVCRYHSKALLVTFDSDNTSGSHVDVLTREVQEGFKRLDGDIRAMGAADGAGEDDAQVCGSRPVYTT
jgi:hypothetical protein